jgi:hypothetical protein
MGEVEVEVEVEVEATSVARATDLVRLGLATRAPSQQDKLGI